MSKLLKLFNSLNNSEKREFGKFLKSPFFNESKINLELFYSLLKHSAKSSSEIRTEEIILNAFTHKNYSPEMRRRIASDFLSLLKEYLVQKELKKEKFVNIFLLLKTLRKRNADVFFEFELKKVKKLMNDFKLRDREYFMDKIRILFEEYIFYYSRLNRKKYLEVSNLSEHSADLLYILSKLNIFINSSIDITFLQTIPKLDKSFIDIFYLIEKYLIYIKANEPEIYIYYLIAKLIKEKGEENSIKKIIRYTKKKNTLLNDNVKEFIYNIVFKYTIILIHHGKFHLIPVAIEILKLMEDKKIFEKMWEIPMLTYLSAVNIHLYMQETNLAIKFIEKYSGRLNPTYRNKIIKVSKALVLFEQNKFEEARILVEKLKTKNILIYIYSKSVLLKIYYETGRYNFIPPVVDTFRQFIIRKHEMDPQMQNSILKFLKYIKRLSNYKLSGKKHPTDISELFKKESNFFTNKWLSEKIESL